MYRSLIAALSTLTAIAGCIVLVALSHRASPAASRPQKSDLPYLTESMLVDENAVPALDRTSWGRMVAVPRGSPPAVRPPECAVFLSQGEASQKGLAMRSSRGAAIGVELAINERRVDLPALLDSCAHFTLDAPGMRSGVHVESMDFGGLPDGAIGTMMHSETTANGRSVAWDIAMITGYHRGVMVTAEYTPGPHGGAFDNALASALPALFDAQIARLDAS